MEKMRDSFKDKGTRAALCGAAREFLRAADKKPRTCCSSGQTGAAGPAGDHGSVAQPLLSQLPHQCSGGQEWEAGKNQSWVNRGCFRSPARQDSPEDLRGSLGCPLPTSLAGDLLLGAGVKKDLRTKVELGSRDIGQGERVHLWQSTCCPEHCQSDSPSTEPGLTPQQIPVYPCPSQRKPDGRITGHRLAQVGIWLEPLPPFPWQ